MSLHILLVDDDLAGLLALSSALQLHLTHPVVVDTAPNGKAALSFLEVKHYDLLICDVRMPEIDGISLLRKVKHGWPTMPAILVTAAGHDREAEAIQEGAYAFIEKPVDLEKLLALIEAALERKNLFRSVQRANTTSLFNASMRPSKREEVVATDEGRSITP